MLSAIRKLAMTRRFLVSVRVRSVSTPRCLRSAVPMFAFRLISSSRKYAASFAYQPLAVLCEPFPPAWFSRGNLRLFTLNKVAHHPGGTGLESLRIEKTTLFMKDFLTNRATLHIVSGSRPFVGQSHSDSETAGSTSPR